jgi:cytochrome c oxidase cbb3-type subunit 3
MKRFLSSSYSRACVSASLTGLTCVWIGAVVWAQAQSQTRPARQSPQQAQPATKASAEQIEAGRVRFAAQCGFCHGRDAGGGETGPDLTRSAVVTEDVRGEKIAALVRSGRPDKGMPALTVPEADMTAIVAFLHDARTKASAQNGGRRSVAVADLQSGNAEAGQRYFNGAGGCAACHQIAGSFATVGSRYQGLPLLQRMLYPGSSRTAGPPPPQPKVTVTTAAGQTLAGRLGYRDEFTISLIDADGWTRSFPIDRVKVTIDDPLQAHVDQLAKYTDDDMHNVLAYLQTLR